MQEKDTKQSQIITNNLDLVWGALNASNRGLGRPRAREDSILRRRQKGRSSHGRCAPSRQTEEVEALRNSVVSVSEGGERQQGQESGQAGPGGRAEDAEVYPKSKSPVGEGGGWVPSGSEGWL